MKLEKPQHVDEKTWKQHLEWMKVMLDGQLTDRNVNKSKEVDKKG